MLNHFSFFAMRFVRLALCALALSVSTAHAAPAPESDLPPTASTAVQQRFQPAIVYLYSKDGADRSFIDAALVGVKKAADEYQIKIPEYRMTSKENISAVLKRAAESCTYSLMNSSPIGTK
jgi:basic membrane lipoprotein Med (substrate-binding protein (PBP1-ABC) superfamily)